ncbi:hypothetical protein GGTG_03128 [Gaeumannomyces tritici R3-111a-1]|uniref:Uncharacterized protein n=1 Tax=Gaeumannomyces tritici (strain R3-111a-1) TaxID=644352 RepID=J3NPC0_GAET3|nr:hypothetical protein GGTG_03128 [Gaeumannomyces tritici R3-111a-1]EJT78025.1 hypothetical protein GGTG_03128 [Gaeumannomyces tritici R3-111a-1]
MPETVRKGKSTGDRMIAKPLMISLCWTNLFETQGRHINAAITEMSRTRPVKVTFGNRRRAGLRALASRKVPSIARPRMLLIPRRQVSIVPGTTCSLLTLNGAYYSFNGVTSGTGKRPVLTQPFLPYPPALAAPARSSQPGSGWAASSVSVGFCQ